MSQTAIWLPPSLCGCQLQITADWSNSADIVDGKTYRHPVPFTIKDIKIVTACAGHAAINRMPDISRLYELDEESGELTQRRGYLQHPIPNPTAAQCLYQFLSFYKGQTHSLPCGCAAHMFGDEKDNFTYIEKPGVTKKCRCHKNDTHNMQQAVVDFNVAVENQAAAQAFIQEG